MTKKDKLRQKKDKKIRESISGRRLNIAREIKKLTWQQLASSLNLEIHTVQKWADPNRNGIPKSRLFFVAKYFNVTEWVFTDKKLTDENFKKIIYDPDLSEKLCPSEVGTTSSKDRISLKQSNDDDDLSTKPVFKFQGKYDLIKGNYFRSDWFDVSGNEFVITTKVWGMTEVTKTRVTIVPISKLAVKAIPPPEMIQASIKKYEGTNKHLSQDSDFQSFDITTKSNTKISDTIEKRNVIKQDGKRMYCLVVRCDYNFELAVYEVN